MQAATNWKFYFSCPRTQSTATPWALLLNVCCSMELSFLIGTLEVAICKRPTYKLCLMYDDNAVSINRAWYLFNTGASFNLFNRTLTLTLWNNLIESDQVRIFSHKTQKTPPPHKRNGSFLPGITMNWILIPICVDDVGIQAVWNCLLSFHQYVAWKINHKSLYTQNIPSRAQSYSLAFAFSGYIFQHIQLTVR